MQVPKRIEPNYLKDTIVQVLYKPLCPPETVIGQFYLLFEEDFEYRPSQNPLLPNATVHGHFYTKDAKVKVEIGERGIVFNSVDEYIGWESYFPLIQNTLNGLKERSIIDTYNRVGIRYISQIPEASLLDKVNVTLNIDLPDISNQTHIRSTFLIEGVNIILNLMESVKRKSSDDLSSIIDIDAYEVIEGERDLAIVLDKIDHLHTIQKHVFFNLLNEEYLATLNPVY